MINSMHVICYRRFSRTLETEESCLASGVDDFGLAASLGSSETSSIEVDRPYGRFSLEHCIYHFCLHQIRFLT